MRHEHLAPERFSDIAGASDCQRFRGALLLMRRIAAAAKEAIPERNEQRQMGVAPVVRFTEMADEFLSSMKRKVDEEMAQGRQFGWQISAQELKARLPGRLEGILFIGVYRIQYELACMCLPPGGEAGGAKVYRISEMFKASGEVSGDLGAFLDSIGVARGEYRDAVETLRGFFMSQSETNARIKEDRAKVYAVFASFMESYVDFRAGAPLEEGMMR